MYDDVNEVDEVLCDGTNENDLWKGDRWCGKKISDWWEEDADGGRRTGG
jgi:hypothetical protein